MMQCASKPIGGSVAAPACDAPRPTVWSIAGSDSAGMAGIQADNRAIQALGGHSANIITAVTAQHSDAVLSVNPVPLATFTDQLDALSSALPAAAIKIGLLPNSDIATQLGRRLADIDAPVVLDPVGVASSGAKLIDGDSRKLLASLLPRVDCLTPNIAEARLLSACPIDSAADLPRAAQALLEQGVRSVLIKGGHLDGDTCSDYFATPEQQFWLHLPRLDAGFTRGTGCLLSAALASVLAQGYVLADAVVIARMWLQRALRSGVALAGGTGGTPGLPGWPHCQIDLPCLNSDPHYDLTRPAFPPCGDQLGLYPVVDRAHWLERLIPLGLDTIQLRIKDLSGAALQAEIARAVALARASGCRLFINDYWRQAIEAGAYGVHLGQEDLEQAELDEIRDAGLRLGLSSHSYYEVARAHSYRPSYIACGPVWPTTTKAMPWQPQGIAGLRHWRQLLDYPIVAIGGINAERVRALVAAGITNLAVITAITEAPDPEAAARELMLLVRGGAPLAEDKQ